MLRILNSAHFIILSICAIAPCAFASDLLVPDLPETLTRHVPGMYLTPPGKPGRVSTEKPLADLNTQEIIEFMRSHPEFYNHRVVISVPSLLRGKGKILEVKAALADMGLPQDIDVIRWPNGSLLENALDFFPRKQDWQKPLPEEIRTGHIMVFGGEALSISLMVYLVLIHQMTLTVGISSTIVDLAQQAIITYPMRAFANYQTRQTLARQFLFNLLYGAIESTNFFLIMNSADLSVAMPKFFMTIIPGAWLAAIWSNTEVAAFRWEFSPTNRMALENRRIFTASALLIQQIILSPFYIYSVSPFAKTLFSLKIAGVDWMDVNSGHVVILTVGALAGLVTLRPFMNRIASLTSWLAEQSGPVGQCVRFLGRERKNKKDIREHKGKNENTT